MLLALLRASLAPLAFAAATTAFGADAVTGFYAGHEFKPLLVDKANVAVRHGTGSKARAVKLSTKAAAAYEQLGVDIVPRQTVRGEDEIVGYPVTFDQEHDAVGVLTHEIVVRLRNGANPSLIKTAAGYAAHAETAFKKRLYLAKFSSPMAALAAANELTKNPGVLYAHPNFLLPKNWRSGAPGPAAEPLFSSQWHLENTGQFGGTAGADIDAKAAWDVTQGDSEVLIAVLDGGFEVTHPDLDGAFWHNSGEIPNNGLDDDGNGYVDDVMGWNFYTKSPAFTTGPAQDHGTAVAGLVGARANGKGVTGVCPKCTILPVVVSWTPVQDAAAFHYAAKAGAAVITNSWGYAVGTPTTDVVREAIDDVAATGRGGKGVVILFAMNNIDQDDCSGKEPDISSLDSVVAVSAANDQDKKVSFSAWGACMEFLSPTYDEGRKGIASTDLTGQRGYNNGRIAGDLPDTDYTNDFGGTSAATPIAAGVFGLMLSVNDALTRDEALAMVIATTDKVHPELAAYNPETGFSQKYGYGRIDAGRAVRAAQIFRKYTRKDPPINPKTSGI